MTHADTKVQDAAKTVPPIILWGMWSNAILMLAMGVTFIFTLGSAEEVLATPVPFIQVFMNATGSYAATNIMTAIIIIMLISASFSAVATSSRQIWAFARDRGKAPFLPSAEARSMTWAGAMSRNADRIAHRIPVLGLARGRQAWMEHTTPCGSRLRWIYYIACTGKSRLSDEPIPCPNYP